MKKFILSSLLSFVGLFSAFTSANSVSFVGDPATWDYTPSSITFNSDVVITADSFSDISCADGYTDGDCYIAFSDDDTTCLFNYYYSDGWQINFPKGSCSLNGTYQVDSQGEAGFDSITLNYSYGDDVGSEEINPGIVGPLLSGGKDSLKPILDGLSGTIFDFIPYLVYVGLGIIVATIGFVAIRWLLNWTQAKVRGSFSSGRRK